MEMTIEHQESVQRQFDAFCKKVLVEEKKTWLHRRAMLTKRETPLSELTEQQTASLSREDVYPSEHFHFDAQGHDVQIDDESLAALLEEMPDQNRTPLLLACGADMKDTEIARTLNVPRSTVNYRRNMSLSTLRKSMAGRNGIRDGGECGNARDGDTDNDAGEKR